MKRRTEETEKRMDAVLRLARAEDRYALRALDIADAAAVARCYRTPYNTYGKIKVYLREFGRLPPAEYMLPRYKWQKNPRAGKRCRTCALRDGDEPCQMLQLMQAAGMRGSVVRCSEYRRKNRTSGAPD